MPSPITLDSIQKEIEFRVHKYMDEQNVRSIDELCSYGSYKKKYQTAYETVKEEGNKKKMDKLETKYRRLLAAVTKKRKLNLFEGLLIGLAFQVLFNLLVDKTVKVDEEDVL